MPVFTAIAAGATALAGAIGFSAAAAGVVGSVAAFAARTLLTIGITKLIANRSGQNATGTSNAGSRVQLPPATDNKLPVVYGSAFIGGVVTDAKLSTDQKTMWYVVSLAEVTDTTAGSANSFGNLYYDNKLITFGTGGDAAKVVSLTTNTAGTPEVDTKIAGNLFVYLFTNGSSSGTNTGGQTAIDILSDTSIPSDQRWNQGIYTADGQSASMANTTFAIVKVIYNQDAGTTGLGSLTVQLNNSLYQPGSVIKDYLLNTRYGCAIPLSKIDTASLAALDSYSAETIIYEPVGGGTATQARYRIDGPINTGQNCLNNLQQMVDSCDSWLQYSEMTGQWKVIINRSYTDYTTLGDLYEVDSSNLIGGIEVNPLDLNGTYNIVEVQYPNKYIKDQTDFQTISLFTDFPELLSNNEPVNKLNIQLPQVNNAVQAKYLALRRLFQGREDLVITFATDYSGIQVEAGDVIKVTLNEYGWTDKLFRVNYVGEQKYPDGSLGATMTAFEYNDTIYDDNLIKDFIPADNTGLSDPNIIGTPNAPTVTLDLANTIATMTVTGTVPSPGQVMYMDFNYGNTSNASQHLYYSTISGNGEPLSANTVVSINSTNLPAGTYYWSVTAKNNNVGVRSPASSPSVVWPGPSVTEWDGNTGGITGNNIQADTITNNNIANSTLTGSKVASNTISSTNLTTTGVTANTYATVGNLQVDAAGRIISIDTGTGGSWRIKKGNSGVAYDVSTLVITGDANVVQNSTGNVNLDITYGYMYFDGNGANSWTADNTPLPLTLGNSATPLTNEGCYIPGGYAYDPGSNSFVAYSISSSEWYPWYNQTSSTLDGYLANSGITPFNPFSASIQQIDDGTNSKNARGEQGWFAVNRVTGFTGTAPDTGKDFRRGPLWGSTSVQVFVDANCTVWAAPYVSAISIANGTANGSYVFTSTMKQIPMVANTVTTIDFPLFGFAGNSAVTATPTGGMNGIGTDNQIQNMGLALRLPQSGANVYVASGYTYTWYWNNSPW